MTKIEELKQIVELLQKHNLPLSPILEYAIKERMDQYQFEEKGISVVREDDKNIKEYKGLEEYIQEFANLSVGIVNGKKLPHKAILLIGLMNLIEAGIITINRIELDNTIADAFSSSWNYYFEDIKRPSIWTPFWYLKSEPFWHFEPKGNKDLLQGLLSFAGHPSIGQMRPVIKYAYLDKALFGYLENEGCRKKLKDVLVNTYITNFG